MLEVKEKAQFCLLIVWERREDKNIPLVLLVPSTVFFFNLYHSIKRQSNYLFKKLNKCILNDMFGFTFLWAQYGIFFKTRIYIFFKSFSIKCYGTVIMKTVLWTVNTNLKFLSRWFILRVSFFTLGRTFSVHHL